MIGMKINSCKLLERKKKLMLNKSQQKLFVNTFYNLFKKVLMAGTGNVQMEYLVIINIACLLDIF